MKSFFTFVARSLPIALALLLSRGVSAQGAARVTGIYSDMTFNHESGDVTGIEVAIVLSKEGFMAIFQDAEGVPLVPIVVPVTVSGSEIVFELPERNGYTGKFVGHLVDGSLIGHFTNGLKGQNGAEFALRRGKSYWQ